MMRELYLLFAVLLANGFVIKGDDLFDDGPCGNTMFKNESGKIVGQDPGKGKTCSYYIVAANYTSQVAISFSNLTINPLLYNLSVYGVNTTGETNVSSVLIANLTQVSQGQAFLTVISGYNVTKIVYSRANLDTPSDAGFTAAYDTTACMLERQDAGGIIQSPLYLPGNGTVTCTYKQTLYQPMGVVSFTSFNLSSGKVTVQFGSGNPVNVSGPVPNDVFGDKNAISFTVNFFFNNNTAAQNFTALFQTVDPRCSGKLDVASTFKQLTIPASNQLPVTCYAQLKLGGEGKVYMENSVNYTQTRGFDNVIFYDGASTQAPVVGTNSDGLQWLVGSKKSLTVVANLGAQSARVSNLQYRSDSYNNFFTLTNQSRSANIDFDGTTISNSTVKVMFLSTNQSLSSIKIELNNNTSLTDGKITVQCQGFMTMFTYTKDSVFLPIIIPSARAMVVITMLTGNQKVSLKATALQPTGCNGLSNGPSGQINFAGASTTEKSCNFLVSTSNDIILEMKQINLCKTGTLDIYQGFNKNSVKYASFQANTSYTIPQIRFPAGSPPRLVWKDNNNTCTGPTVVARYWSQDNGATCGALGAGMSGNINTPNFPNQYPLNVMCNWTLPVTVNTSMMYLTVKSLDFQRGHSLTLQNTSTSSTIANFTGTSSDLIVPNRNLSMIFNATLQGSTQTGQGAQLMYKVLTCGGLVTNYPANLTVPKGKNQSVECIWIIQVPLNGTKQSVNIVLANITVKGYKNASNGVLEIHDGSSVRDQSITVNMTQKNTTTVYSRTNFLFVRYAYTISTNQPFTFNFTYATFNCNSTSQCDNGVCIHPDWRCNGVPDCRDGKDEKHCNGSQPIPPAPTPAPNKGGKKAGVASYWVVICLLLGVVIGVMLTIFVPKCIRNVRGRNRSPGSNYGSLHEDT
ncbi:cubilin-like [Ruditapes philippinarum]|uniref:cubilin-like n=1 Tax=Ruditapes philippinarum TaxID=129788 RepID=UPI00295AD310|nr:cubilin-like [Ruditapes philippinarum]XP_060582014.1 cubilin-like [Ruditapes philippinarum]